MTNKGLLFPLIAIALLTLSLCVSRVFNWCGTSLLKKSRERERQIQKRKGWQVIGRSFAE